MRYTVRKSILNVVGRPWQGGRAAMSYNLSDTDVRKCKDPSGRLTRESVGKWLNYNSGDFESLYDWAASLEDGDCTVDIGWSTPDGEDIYAECYDNGEDPV